MRNTYDAVENIRGYPVGPTRRAAISVCSPVPAALALGCQVEQPRRASSPLLPVNLPSPRLRSAPPISGLFAFPLFTIKGRHRLSSHFTRLDEIHMFLKYSGFSLKPWQKSSSKQSQTACSFSPPAQFPAPLYHPSTRQTSNVSGDHPASMVNSIWASSFGLRHTQFFIFNQGSVSRRI